MIFEMKSALETTFLELLTENVANYQKTLTEKLKNEHFTFSEDGSVVNKNNNTSKQDKLIARYTAITKLNDLFIQKAENNAPIEEADLSQAKETLKFCFENKPDWSERPFLQKLTDILSLGLKVLHRSFFSKENKAEKELGKLLRSKPQI